MANKIKNEFVAYSESAIRNNLSIVEYCRTSVSAVSGCTAGVLGLTGLFGAIFFIIAVTTFWFMLLFKAGIDSWKKYFISRKSLLLNGIFGHFFTYILCWTFIYGMDKILVLKFLQTMGDERNFRSAYYEKVGFRSVEEKKSLEILLKEKPLDCEKLKQFCLRYCVPACYRNLVWKLLLGIIPVHMDSHHFIIEQRKQEYQELYRALTVMRIIDSNTPKPQVISAMCSLRSGNFTMDSNIVTTRPFDRIVYAFMEYSDDDADIFWMFKNFWESVQKFHPELDKLVEKTFYILEKEDPDYYKIIEKNNLFKNLPVDKWIDCCFAGVLKDIFVEKIWDKFLGGSYLILAFASVMLLMTLRGRITRCTTLAASQEFVKCLPDETAGIITNKAIELWQNYGSPLTLHDKLKP